MPNPQNSDFIGLGLNPGVCIKHAGDSKIGIGDHALVTSADAIIFFPEMQIGLRQFSCLPLNGS